MAAIARATRAELRPRRMGLMNRAVICFEPLFVQRYGKAIVFQANKGTALRTGATLLGGSFSCWGRIQGEEQLDRQSRQSAIHGFGRFFSLRNQAIQSMCKALQALGRRLHSRRVWKAAWEAQNERLPQSSRPPAWPQNPVVWAARRAGKCPLPVG